MTAKIVHSLARSIVLDAEMLEDAATMPQSAEHSRRDIRGQLWVREAERSAAAEEELRSRTDESSLNVDMGWG